MNRHPYLRAYLAGIALPTIFLPLGFLTFVIAHAYCDIPIQIERAIAFPLAFVPNLWGLWNMLHLRLQMSFRWPIGPHGALAPVVFVPFGYMAARELGVTALTPSVLFIAWPILIAVYYLIWKYLVGFLNEQLGIG